MKKPLKVVADAKIPFLPGVLDRVATVELLPGRQIGRSDVKDADALIVRTRTRCDASLLDGSAVKFIATATIGFDHVDTEWCDRTGIVWTNAPGCNSSSVAQYVLSVLFRLATNHEFDLSGKTIGIVGVGHVGSKIERLARILGLKVLLNDPPRARAEGDEGFVSLERILEESEIISLHVPLNIGGRDKTQHLVDRAFLGALQRRVWLINTSRGPVVDSEALKATLKEGRLAGAVLDVWEGEPRLDLELMGICRIATPHIAGYSLDGKANGTSMSLRALSRFFGLGLDHWYPEKIPSPAKECIAIDGAGRSRQESLAEAVLQSYDVLRDDASLRRMPEEFEKLREEYPVRREPGAWKVGITNDAAGARPILEQIGFQVLKT